MINNRINNQGLVRKGALALVLVTGLLGACEANQPQANAPVTTTEREAMDNRAVETDPQVTNPVPTTTNPPGTIAQTETTDVEEVADNTDQLIGQTVTVKGEVEESYGSNLYRVQEQGEIFGDSVLVLAVPAQPGATLVADQNVQVTGEVQKLVMAEFERDYDLTWDLSIKEKIEAEYEGKPVVIAETVQVYE